MGLISSSIPNFVNGISQQPFTLRLASQGELQENGFSTVSQGLKKRPATKHIAKLYNTPLSVSGAFIHPINRDTTERYIVVITNGDLKVFSLDGVEQTVNFPNGKGYLSSTNPKENFRATSVADYTFIVNRSVTVTENTGETLQADRGYEALVSVKAGNYGKTYQVLIDGTVRATYTTPDGSVASQSPMISTDYIATQLKDQLVTYFGGSATIVQAGSVIWISKSTDFAISTTDGFANNAMIAIKRKLQRFSDLPSRSPVDGFVVEVVGDSNSSFDNYWVKYDASGVASSGVWKETCQPTLSAGVTPSTMPWALVRESDGTFTFKQLTWGKRKVGDATSNPHPSFVGRKLNDVFFYRNRLGLLCDENIIFSEAGEFFNFYRTTVTQLLDSEAIDVAVSHTKVSILEHALPFNKQLLIFSGQTQFVVDQADILSPKTVSVKMTTEFPCSTKCKPINAGRNVYFTVDKGDWTAMREFYADANNLSNDSLDVTAHVPKYIPSGVFKMAASANEDVICLVSSNEPNAVYVYKYFWSSNEKLQSAWSKWVFPSTDTVLNAEFIESELFIVISRTDGVYVEKMNLSLGYSEDNEPYPVLLDRKVAVTPTVYSDYKTRLTLPFVPPVGQTFQAVTGVGGSKKAGIILEVKADGSGPYVDGNFTGTPLIVGRQYRFIYQLSTITVKTAQAGGGQKSDTEGRLQLRKIAFNYADTGFFDVWVKPHNRDIYKYRYSGKVLGAETATIGQVSFDTGRFLVPVMTRNVDTQISLINDSPAPCSILSADWEGFYVKRSQPV